MQAVSQFFREEKDFLFQRGEAIGEARGAEKEHMIAEAKIREEKRAIARAMKADGLPAVKICKFTGLTPDEIEGL